MFDIICCYLVNLQVDSSSSSSPNNHLESGDVCRQRLRCPSEYQHKNRSSIQHKQAQKQKKRGMACRRGHVTCAAFLCGHQPPLMMYVCMYVCMYVFMYVCMYACMYVCMYVCMYDAIYIYNVCICMYVYVCMYMYVCNYILVRVRENASWTGPLEESNID